MTTFIDILNKFRKESFSQRDKGFRFERLMQAYLRTTTQYESRFENVWLWLEFPYHNQFGGKDVGIDLVAQTFAGDYWAIQCKCYDKDSYINKPDVDSFLSTSGKTFEVDGRKVGFSQRLWISTTNNWGPTAELTVKNQTLPFTRLNLIDIDADDVDWERLEQGLFGKASRLKPFDIKEHQQKAIDKTHEYLKNHERGKLIMACGTGKTFTSLKIAENETGNKGLVLFMVPSIALLGQTLRSWSQQATVPINAVCICSDAEVSKQEEKNDENIVSTIDLALPASTDIKNIADQLEAIHRAHREGMTVVFSTYQSIEVISKAQKEVLHRTNDTFGVFDLIICDEAHRTTGVTLKDEKESTFVKVHRNDFIQAKHRIYMTATPRLYTDETKRKAEENSAVLCSMDDKAMYGDEIYRIGFGEAVEKNLLTDYKVLILAVGEKDITPTLQKAITQNDGVINADDASKFIGVINALSKKMLGDDEGLIKNADPLPMRRAVAFCSSIKSSKAVAQVFTECKDLYMEDILETEKSTMVDVVAHHVDGTMSATSRDKELMWLKGQTDNDMECRMLTNARCLSEGVDVPSLDAVVFVSPKNSQVDVVQSVGRVMRRSEGKKYGYIIIPVVVPSDAEGEVILEKHPNFKVVWTVLNALRAHDDRFNAEINKIELSKRKPKNILFGGVGVGRKDSDDGTKSSGDSKPDTDSAAAAMARQLQMSFNDLQNVFYAKMVQKVGTKRYWEQWARDIAQIAEEHIERIKNLIADDGKHRRAFDSLMRGLRRNINPGLSEQDVIEMLSQHIITRPVFEALFENYEFAQSNPVSKSMQRMLDLLDDEVKTEEEHEKLQKFYDYVRTTVGKISDAEGRQRIIVELYDKFFKTASPKTVEKLGIVYTPVEVVDFIINSVGYILKKEFGRSLSDENVHILDPFTGTGTFITRLLQSGQISRAALERKYGKEIHANEIVLMAYYIASINIENVFHDLIGPDAKYKPFDGICLTDTFQLGEDLEHDNESRAALEEIFPANSQRVKRQRKKRITVIVGNPPYSVGQKSANDNAQNRKYPTLDKHLGDTYAKGTDANNKNSLYDSYIKAFRWASDRIDPENGGVIGFVTNGNWLDGNAQNGMRKCLEREFSSIYVFNLRGNCRTSGEIRRKEGDGVFGLGSRTPIAITILVKKPKAADIKAHIFYHDIGDYLSREDKLNIIRNMGNIGNPQMQWTHIEPNKHGDWLNKRSELFNLFTPLGNKDDKKDKKTFFVPYYSNGLKTQRDSWCYNSSLAVVKEKAVEQIDFYNEQCRLLSQGEIAEVDYSTARISWTRAVLADAHKCRLYNVESCQYVESIYRPFFKQHLLFYKPLNEMVYQIPKLFPTPQHKNLVICVSGIGASKDFSALMTDLIPCLDMVEKSQCFPLYWYDDSTSDIADLFTQGVRDDKADMDRWVRRDGVTDWILSTARKQYGSKVTKEDIFYYVYGILHSPDYRAAFSADLKKSLPRLPLVEAADDFWTFSKAGRDLASLHLNYETVEPYAGCRIVFSPLTDRGGSMNYRVEKMRFGKKDSKMADKGVIYYNSGITIENIPLEAYDYVVNGKSAIEWIMERYAVTVNKDSGISNDPNDWAAEHDDEKYIFNLLLRIITVSLETMKIVRSLPELKLEE